MSANIESFPCKACKKEVSDGIKCDVCCGWMHQRCSRLNKRIFNLYCVESQLIWVCIYCRNVAKEALEVKLKASCFPDQNQKPNKSLSSDVIEPRKNSKTKRERPGCVNTTNDWSSQNLSHVVTASASKPSLLTQSPNRVGQKPQAEATTSSTRPSYRDVLVSTLTPKRNALNNLKGGKNDKPAKSQTMKKAPTVDMNLVSKLQAEVDHCNKDILTLTQEFKKLKLRYDTELGRNRNILIHGFDERVSTIPHVRRKAHEAIVKTILRNADLLTSVRWRRIHRVGRWLGGCPPRPLLVEFCSQRDRDIVLSRLPRIYDRLRIPLTITPDVKDHVGKPQIKGTNASSGKSPRVVLNPVDKPPSEETNTIGYTKKELQKDQVERMSYEPEVDLTEAVEETPTEIWHDASDGTGQKLPNTTELTVIDGQPTPCSTVNAVPPVGISDDRMTSQSSDRVTRSMTAIRKNAMIPRANCPRD